jgi:predicted transcriptional regulator YdeE
MKIVKYIFLLLLLAAIATTVFIATQEGKYDIKKERVIKVPKSVLYNYINEFKNWENAGILSETDTTATYTYSENTNGRDAFITWKKKGNTGRVQTVRLTESDSIVQNAVINNLNSEVFWKFKDTLANSTKVSIRLKGHLTFTEKAYALLNGSIDNDNVKATLEKSLNNLDYYLVHELNTYKVEVKGLVNKTGTYYLGHFTSTKIADINTKISETFPKLFAFIEDNKIPVNGSPFILYKKFDTQADIAEFAVCMPIKEEIYTTAGSDFEGGKLLPFTALKTTLKGDYSHLKKAWDAAKRHITNKALQENTTGQYLEIYTKGMKQTKRPSEWITDIYIPIGQPTVTPAVTGATMPPVSAPAQRPSTVPATLKSATGTTPKPVTKPATTPGTGTTTPAAAKPVVKKPATPKPVPATTTTPQKK